MLSVVDLKRTDIATMEDRQWKIDYWAALFKATTWEEIRMLAQQNPIMEEAAVTMYEMSAEDSIREQCRAREEYYRTLNTFQAELEQKDKELERKDQELERKGQVIDRLNQEIRRLREQLENRELTGDD